MRRAEFMKELEYLLQDIPDEEKEEALAYYRDYLEEAGDENEEQVNAGNLEVRNGLQRLFEAIWTAIWKTEESLRNPGIRTSVSGNRITRLLSGWICQRRVPGSRRELIGRKEVPGRKTEDILKTGSSRTLGTECG